MALSDERIAELRHEACKIAPLHRSAATPFARAVESEVRGQDEALIRQLTDAAALPSMKTEAMLRQRDMAIDAARAWLEGKP